MSLVISPCEFTDDKVQLLKNTVCKGANNDELELFLHVCNRTGLDPFRNQIYAIKRKEKMTIQTGIDGFRLIAERTGKYSPGREPSYTYDQQGKLKSATSYIKKQTTDGTWHEISATAFWSEYVQEYNGKPSNFWAKMPHTMLAKVAESICLRKSFPADFSGIYTKEEMGQADNNDDSPQIENQEQPSFKELGDEAKKNQVINAEPIQDAILEPEEENMKPEEILLYLDHNWRNEQKEFKEFMDEISKEKSWTFRKCIQTFEKHKDFTRKSFEGWKAARVGI